MVRPADGRPVARMVELRAVQAGFPLYGAVELQGGQIYSHALVEHHGVLVRPELLTTLGLAVGDQLAIGRAMFTIRGVIKTEPGRRVGGFSLGPRVLIDHDDLGGPVNVASPNPLPQRDMMRVILRERGMPFGLHATRWMLEAAAYIHRTEAELILKSRYVVPAKLLESGFKFHFPRMEDAVHEIESRLHGKLSPRPQHSGSREPQSVDL